MPKRRRLNRDVVIDRAAALADEAGAVEAVSLAALAKALNIRPPSLYNHVDGLDDLRQGMALFGAEQLTGTLREATAGLVGREALSAMAQAYRRFAQAHPGLYPLTIRAPDPEDKELSDKAQELLQMLLLVMASVGLQGKEALHAIRGFRAVLHGFVALEAAGGYKMLLDREESFQRMVAAYLDGIAEG
jgi:AcrR family transcriptional regulator